MSGVKGFSPYIEWWIDIRQVLHSMHNWGGWRVIKLIEEQLKLDTLKIFIFGIKSEFFYLLLKFKKKKVCYTFA